MINYLEKIATDLIEGRIDNSKAEALCTLPQENSFYIDSSREGRLELRNSSKEYLAYIDYLFNGGDSRSIFLLDVHSFQERKGYFRILFSELLNLADERDVERLYLNVHRGNSNAIDIYRKYGFVNSGALSQDGFFEMERVSKIFQQ